MAGLHNDTAVAVRKRAAGLSGASKNMPRSRAKPRRNAGGRTAALMGWLRALPRYTLPLMAATWVFQGIAFYLPKLLMKEAPHHSLALAVDQYVPLLPFTAVIYLAAFASWPLCYLYCAAQEKKRAYRFLCAEFLAKVICLAFFLLLPTAIDRPAVTGNSVFELMVRFVYWFDSPTNLFPSIHCLMSWLAYLGVRDAPRASKKAAAVMLVFALAVFVSTVTMRQHYIVDIFAGVAVAELCYRLAANRKVLSVYTKAADRIVDLVRPRA